MKVVNETIEHSIAETLAVGASSLIHLESASKNTTHNNITAVFDLNTVNKTTSAVAVIQITFGSFDKQPHSNDKNTTTIIVIMRLWLIRQS